MIDVLKSLKERANNFENTSGERDILAIAIVNVGFFLDLLSY